MPGLLWCYCQGVESHGARGRSSSEGRVNTSDRRPSPRSLHAHPHAQEPAGMPLRRVRSDESLNASLNTKKVTVKLAVCVCFNLLLQKKKVSFKDLRIKVKESLYGVKENIYEKLKKVTGK